MSGPEPSHRCDNVLLVQAEFDGELDAAQAAALSAHRQHCPVCQAAAQALARARGLMHEGLYQPAPDDVRRRIIARLDRERPAPVRALGSRLRAWWGAGIGFGLGAACALVLALLLVAPGEQNLTRELVADHIRALQPGHLEDVVSTNQHTVKPWFDGRLDFSPPVKDLAAIGFPLKGGRLDYLDSRTVAVLVYQRAKHIIDLYVWPQTEGAGSAPETTERHGYNVVNWTQNGMTFWAVSDVERSQLLDFAKAWRRSP
ncbi:MAG TPA: anti-sigma factor [Stellaceae bacterium]|jgi:anti-sigma factor RsiW